MYIYRLYLKHLNIKNNNMIIQNIKNKDKEHFCAYSYSRFIETYKGSLNKEKRIKAIKLFLDSTR